MATKRRDRKFWRRLFAKVEAGGSVAEVARRYGVRDQRLKWWCWKLRGEQHTGAEGVQGPELLPVVLREPPLAVVPAALEVAVEWQDVRVVVPVGADTTYVAALLGALRAC